jgi:predicted Zn-dependent protease
LMQASRLGESATPLIRLAELELEAGNSDAARSALLKIASRKLELDAGQQARVDAVLQKLQSPE